MPVAVIGRGRAGHEADVGGDAAVAAGVIEIGGVFDARIQHGHAHAGAGQAVLLESHIGPAGANGEFVAFRYLRIFGQMVHEGHVGQMRQAVDRYAHGDGVNQRQATIDASAQRFKLLFQGGLPCSIDTDNGGDPIAGLPISELLLKKAIAFCTDSILRSDRPLAACEQAAGQRGHQES